MPTDNEIQLPRDRHNLHLDLYLTDSIQGLQGPADDQQGLQGHESGEEDVPDTPGSPYALRFPGSEETRRRLYVDLGRPRPFYRRPSEGHHLLRRFSSGDEDLSPQGRNGSDGPCYGDPKSLQVISFVYLLYHIPS